MRRVDEAVNALCPQGSFGVRSELALRPFGSCGECAHMSYMTCKANTSTFGQNFMEKNLQYTQNFS